MEDLMQFLFFFMAIIIILLICCYVFLAIFLNKFNNLKYGKKTPLAWIPFTNIYLLGKLTFNKIAGWVLLVLCLLSGSLTVNINGHIAILSLPSTIQLIISAIYSGLFTITLIFGIIGYEKLKKGNIKTNEVKYDSKVEEIVKANNEFFNQK